MKIQYDAEVDAMRIAFAETTVTTVHLTEGVAVDYDADGRLVGLEILDVRERLPDLDVLGSVTLEGVGLQRAAA
jgi:YD repeat-containing protein